MFDGLKTTNLGRFHFEIKDITTSAFFEATFKILLETHLMFCEGDYLGND